MITSGGALKALVTLGVTMLLIAWAMHRLVLPEIKIPDDAVGAIEAHYSKHYIPADMLNLRDFGASCRRGVLTSCTALGRQISGLRFEIPELAPPECLELPLFEQACDGGEMIGCTELAHVLRGRHCGEPDPTRAQTLYARACAANVERACAWLDQG